jgi:hypothetical protein
MADSVISYKIAALRDAPIHGDRIQAQPHAPVLRLPFRRIVEGNRVGITESSLRQRYCSFFAAAAAISVSKHDAESCETCAFMQALIRP